MFVVVVPWYTSLTGPNIQTISTNPNAMTRKSPEKLMQDERIDEIRPYLPPNYAQIARHFFPHIDAMRLYDVVRKRGTEDDPEALRALLAVKTSTPVERKPRKKHRSRKPELV